MGTGTFMVDHVVDPVTMILALFGLALVKYLGWMRWLVMIGCLVLIAVLTCGIAPYPNPSLTRTMYLMFPISLMATAGFDRLFSRSRWIMFPALILLGIAVAGWNWIKTHEYDPYEFLREYEMHLIQRVQESTPDERFVFVFPETKDPYLGRKLMEAYRYTHRVAFVKEDMGDLRKVVSLGLPLTLVPYEGCANPLLIRWLANEIKAKYGEPIPIFGKMEPPWQAPTWKKYFWVVTGVYEQT
jgi:hypothetical protein